jgi:hypothetical protein
MRSASSPLHSLRRTERPREWGIQVIDDLGATYVTPATTAEAIERIKAGPAAESEIQFDPRSLDTREGSGSIGDEGTSRYS